ncbi:MAG: hypothetical protein ACRBCL_17385 [Maritimibacter sp.]
MLDISPLQLWGLLVEWISPQKRDAETYFTDVERYFRCMDQQRREVFEQAREVSEDYARVMDFLNDMRK